jgi:hypothetical protein
MLSPCARLGGDFFDGVRPVVGCPSIALNLIDGGRGLSFCGYLHCHVVCHVVSVYTCVASHLLQEPTVIFPGAGYAEIVQGQHVTLLE